MAVLSLNTNIASLRTQRRLAQSTSLLSAGYERLSSGLRVSGAADDAAGLAVASGLNVDSRVFSQGLRNLSDGVSVANIAEGALNELSNIVTRLQELAEQSANGTIGVKQRAALDAEAQALAKEYFRISRTTGFNGAKLFDGSIQGLSLQGGYGAAAVLFSSLGGKLATGQFETRVTYATGSTAVHAVGTGDLNGDGILDIVCSNGNGVVGSAGVLLGCGDGGFGALITYDTGPAATALGLVDLNDDGILDIATANDIAGGTISVLLGNGDGSFKTRTDYAAGSNDRGLAFGDINGDGKIDLVAANGSTASVSIMIGNGDGSFRAKSEFATALAPRGITLGDVNNDGALDIVASSATEAKTSIILGNGDGSFRTRTDLTDNANGSSVALADLNGDGLLDLASTHTVIGSNTISIFIGNGDGSFRGKSEFATGDGTYAASLVDFNGDGAIDVITADGGSVSLSLLSGNGDGSFAARTTVLVTNCPVSVAHGDFNRDGVVDLVSVNADNEDAAVLLATTRDGISPLLCFSLRTKSEAKWALELMKQKLTQLGVQRGRIGANQSRLSTAVANLKVEGENYDAAASRIIEADVAEESAQLVSSRIRQRAASAVLAQANQAPALALKLIGG